MQEENKAPKTEIGKKKKKRLNKMRSPYKVLSNRIHGAGVKGQTEGQSFLLFPGLCNGTLSCSLPLPHNPRCLPWVIY